MAMQEFLASYAVEVDESGAKRLQEVLEGNREMAQTLAGAFEAARGALSSLSSELGSFDPQGLLTEGLLGEPLPKAEITAELDTSEAEASAESYTAQLEALRPKLKVNTSGITSAVSGAVASIRSMLASLNITVPVTAVASLDTSGLPEGSGGSAGNGAQSAGASGSSGAAGAGNGNAGHGGGTGSVPAIGNGGQGSVPVMGNGGRVSQPTVALIGEEREPEYVIPVKKEEQALPLIREMLNELSERGRELLLGSRGAPAESSGEAAGDLTGMVPGTGADGFHDGGSLDFSVLWDGLARLTQIAGTMTQSAGWPGPEVSHSIEAPVTINVSAAEARPEEIGRSVYDLAQRYLLRTMEGVFS